MTAFTRTDIPASIDTVEKLAVWVADLLAYLNPKVTAIEGTKDADAVTVRVSQFSPYFISAVADDYHWRCVARQSIRLNSNWQAGGTKIWTHALELSTTVDPSILRASMPIPLVAIPLIKAATELVLFGSLAEIAAFTLPVVVAGAAIAGASYYHITKKDVERLRQRALINHSKLVTKPLIKFG
jgi:hypothetical protein